MAGASAGKRFRRAVSGIPTAVFRNRLAAMAAVRHRVVGGQSRLQHIWVASTGNTPI